MPTQHALLSASSSSRWINCPPSARLGEIFPNKSSEYAAQGTDAHSLCEYKVNKLLGNKPTYPELHYLDEEMEECTDAYVQYVMGELAKARQTTSDPVVIVEQGLDFSKYVPDGFGTGDCLIIADDTLSVIDMKYGLGVLVEAEGNPQMMCYALGALELFDGIYDINQVKMTIFQPRRENISTQIISKKELIAWAEDVLAPSAKIAYEGGGEFNCGKWCKFCPAKNACRKRAEHNLELAQYEFKPPELLDDVGIEGVLERVDDLVSWVNDIKEYAFQQAMSGKQWSSFKLVEGRSTRKYTDEELVASTVTKAGYDPFEKKLLGITAMTKALGKKHFDELLGNLVEKPKGKLTLVPVTDKRQAVDVTNVNDDFNDLTEEN
jgi:hypothetical protein